MLAMPTEIEMPDCHTRVWPDNFGPCADVRIQDLEGGDKGLEGVRLLQRGNTAILRRAVHIIDLVSQLESPHSLILLRDVTVWWGRCGCYVVSKGKGKC